MLCSYNCVFQIRLGAGRSTYVNDEKAFEKGIRFFVDGDPNDRLTKDRGVSFYINNIVYEIKTLGGNKYININKVHDNREDFNELREGYHQFDQVHNWNTARNEGSSSENGVDWTKSNNSLGSERNLSTTSENYIDIASEESGSSVSEEAVERPLKNMLSSDEGDGRKINETNAVPNIRETDKQYSRIASKINTEQEVKSKTKHSSNDATNDAAIQQPKDKLKSKDDSKSNNESDDKLSAVDGQSYTKIFQANYKKGRRDIIKEHEKKVQQERDVKTSEDDALLLKSTPAKSITKYDFGAKRGEGLKVKNTAKSHKK